MKQILAIMLCILVPFAIFAADKGYKVAHDGGSVPNIMEPT